MAKRRIEGKSGSPTFSPLLYGGFLELVQVGVEAIGRYQVIVGAHLGHDTPVQHADHVGVPYGGQTVGYSDARSALLGFVEGSLHDLRAEKISDYAIREFLIVVNARSQRRRRSKREVKTFKTSVAHAPV